MLIHRPSLNSDMALTLAKAATEIAKDRELRICVAILGAAGELLVFLRNDDAIPAAQLICQQKAKTALHFRTATQQLFERSLERPSLQSGFSNQPDIMLLPGGIPLFADGVCIGAIGVSGAKDYEDVEIAQAALRQTGLDSAL
jgi:uncharacterized protein GlcG (DUF336 family)